MTKIPVSIIIVNWNAGQQLLDCIYSIRQHHNNLVESVIVIDNASEDDSIAKVETLEALPFKLEITKNSSNRGFAAACNQGATLATADYLLFLNPDTRLFENSLLKTIEFMEHPHNINIGICGIQLKDDLNHTSTSAANFPTLRVILGKVLALNKLFPNIFPNHLMSSAELNKSGYVDQVIGAFFLIRKNVFDQCNGFDEQFFVYFEEVDLSLRAKKLGHLSYFLSEASAFHKGGGCSERVKSTRLFYSLRSRIYYAKKHYSTMEFVFLLLITAIELPLRLAQGILRLSTLDIINVLSAYKRLIIHFITA
jgi:hypothetical protein